MIANGCNTIWRPSKTESMKAVTKEIRKFKFTETIHTIVLTLFILINLFCIETITAQIQTFPNSNQPPKARTLQELHQQQQVQAQRQNRQQMERLGSQPPPLQQQITFDYYDQQALSLIHI